MRPPLQLAAALFIVGLACLNLGRANSFLPLGSVGITAAPPAYTGPGDLATFTGFYSFRCYNQAMATGSTKVINITRASDSTSTDIVCKNTGDFDTATASSFCNSTTCTGWFYDQVGGGLPLSSPVDTFPTLTFNCINTSLPCWKATGSGNIFMMSAASYTPTQTILSIYSVAYRASGSTAAIPFMQVNGSLGNYFRSRGGVADNWQAVSGGVDGNCINVTATDGAAHLGIFIGAAGSSTFAIDGGSAGTGTCTGTTSAGRIGSFAGQTSSTDEARIYEEGFKDSATSFTGPEQANLHTNVSAYWGTP